VASRSRVVALGKGITIPCALRLAAKRHGDAAPVNTTLTEYWMDQAAAVDSDPDVIALAHRMGSNCRDLRRPSKDCVAESHRPSTSHGSNTGSLNYWLDWIDNASVDVIFLVIAIMIIVVLVTLKMKDRD